MLKQNYILSPFFVYTGILITAAILVFTQINTISAQESDIIPEPNLDLIPKEQPSETQTPQASNKKEQGKKEKDDDKGFFSSIGSFFFDEEEEEPQQEIKTPPYTERKKIPHTGHISAYQQKLIPEKDIPTPFKRPRENYRTQILPSLIYKKSYSNENSHLPKARYLEEDINLLFNSIALGKTDLVRTLIKKHGNTEITDQEGNTPLIYATMAANVPAFLTMLNMSANVNAKNNIGISPLYIASYNDDITTVKLLLNNNANANITDHNGTTPLMAAAVNNYPDIVKLLHQKGADIHLKRKNGETALHLSSRHDSSAAGAMLISVGANINEKNFYGQTPLIVAATNNSLNMVNILLSNNANIKIKDGAGNTAFETAKTHNFAQIAQTIETNEINLELEKAKLAKIRKKRFHPQQTAAINGSFLNQGHSVTTQKSNIPIPIPIPNPLRDKKAALAQKLQEIRKNRIYKVPIYH